MAFFFKGEKAICMTFFFFSLKKKRELFENNPLKWHLVQQKKEIVLLTLMKVLWIYCKKFHDTALENKLLFLFPRDPLCGRISQRRLYFCKTGGLCV